MVSKRLFLGIVLIFLVIVSLGFVFSGILVDTVISIPAFSVVEDLTYNYTFVINNTDPAPTNFTQVNITFPAGFVIDGATNATDANGTFRLNGQTVSWTGGNASGIVNQTVRYFAVNATMATPGNHSFTISATTTSLQTYTYTLFSVTINDTTVPTPVTIVYPANFGNYSLYYLDKNMTFNLTAADNYQLKGCNYTLSNGTGNVNATMGNASASAFGATNTSVMNKSARYAVAFECLDTTGNVNKTLTLNFTVDNDAPNSTSIVTPTGATNITSSPYILNATASDNLSGTGIASVYFNITNSTGAQAAYVLATNYSGNNNNWTFSLVTANNATYPDGNYNITLYAFDYAGNVNNSQKSNFTVDNNGPLITLYEPTDGSSSTTTAHNFTFNVTSNVDVFNCTLVVDGAIAQQNASRINTTATNGMYNDSFAVGAHNWSINCTDILGVKSNSSTKIFTVTAAAAAAAASSSSGGAAVTQYWTSTHVLTNEQFTQGYTKELAVKHRMKFTINNIEHSAGVIALTTTTATINVSSTPQTATLNIGDTRRFDVTDDNYYDVQATLNSISNNKADITIKSIHEEVTVETTAEEAEKETVAAEVKETEEIEARKTALWTLLIIIAVIIIAVIVYVIYKKRKY